MHFTYHGSNLKTAGYSNDGVEGTVVNDDIDDDER